METATIDTVELPSSPPAAVQRNLTCPPGTTVVALIYYELDPGKAFAYGSHNDEIRKRPAS